MEAKPRHLPVDYEGLAQALLALGYPTRLKLLDALRVPHTVGELAVQPHRSDRGASSDRAIARQTVQTHLDRLVESELVRAELVEHEGRPARRYVVNPQKLYGLVEELRRLSVMYAGKGPAGDATGTLADQRELPRLRGPRLVLVHGVYEGKQFPLTEVAGAAPWLIGRRRGLAVSLDYDPYVSIEHAAVRRDSGAFTLTDLEESKNGTILNWTPLPKGRPATLEPGDVIGVGRSHLVFVPK